MGMNALATIVRIQGIEMNLLRYSLVAVLAAAVTVLLRSGPDFSPVAVADASPVVQTEVPTLAPMIKQVLPAVVNVSIVPKYEQMQNPLLQDPFFRRFFGVPEQQQQPRSAQPQPVGSGVIVDARKGYVLTNHHVIEQADKVEVTLADERTFKAKVIGSDADTDIAVLQLEDPEKLSALPVADSDKLEVGDFVVAIGNPLGRRHTVTSGIVSALWRATCTEGLQDFIQTDAAINPGNSGGALVNLRGELVGINSQILSRSGGNIGIGFAIPTNLAKSIMDQLIEFGDIKRGFIGITGQPLSPELARAFGLDGRHGAVVTQVLPDSPADKAGLKTEDVIVAVDGQEVRNMLMLKNAIGLKRVGDTVTVTLIRDGKERKERIKIGDSTESGAPGEAPSDLLDGATFGPIPDDHPLAGQVEGVMIRSIDAGSAAAYAGLRPGDVIDSVNRRNVTDMASFSKAVKDQKELLLLVRRGPASMYIVLR